MPCSLKTYELNRWICTVFGGVYRAAACPRPGLNFLMNEIELLGTLCIISSTSLVRNELDPILLASIFLMGDFVEDISSLSFPKDSESKNSRPSLAMSILLIGESVRAVSCTLYRIKKIVRYVETKRVCLDLGEGKPSCGDSQSGESDCMQKGMKGFTALAEGELGIFFPLLAEGAVDTLGLLPGICVVESPSVSASNLKRTIITTLTEVVGLHLGNQAHFLHVQMYYPHKRLKVRSVMIRRIWTELRIL